MSYLPVDCSMTGVELHNSCFMLLSTVSDLPMKPLIPLIPDENGWSCSSTQATRVPSLTFEGFSRTRADSNTPPIEMKIVCFLELLYNNAIELDNLISGIYNSAQYDLWTGRENFASNKGPVVLYFWRATIWSGPACEWQSISQRCHHPATELTLVDLRWRQKSHQVDIL